MKKGVAVIHNGAVVANAVVANTAVTHTAWRPIRIKVARQLKMVKRWWMVVFIAPLASFAMDFSEAEKLIKSYDSATRAYLYDRLASEGDQLADGKRICGELPGGGVTQILRINQEGAIDLVVSNVQTEQSACFEKLFMGRTFKAPPTAPIYIKHKVGYTK